MRTYQYEKMSLEEAEYHRQWKSQCALSSCPMNNSNSQARKALRLSLVMRTAQKPENGVVPLGQLQRGYNRETLNKMIELLGKALPNGSRSSNSKRKHSSSSKSSR